MTTLLRVPLMPKRMEITSIEDALANSNQGEKSQQDKKEMTGREGEFYDASGKFPSNEGQGIKNTSRR